MKQRLLMLLCLVLLAGVVASAQFRIEAGGSVSNLRGADNKTSLNLKNGIGYRLGAAYEIKLLPFVYLSPGLQLRNNVVPVSSLDLGKMTYTDVAVPLNLGVRVGLGLVGLSAEAGAYASYNLKSSYSLPTAMETISSLGNINLADLKAERLRYGVGASVAVHFTKLYIRGGVDYDLNDLYKDGNKFNFNNIKTEVTSLKSQNMTAYMSLGLRF